MVRAKKSSKKKGGRPPKFGEDIVRKLEEAFRSAGSITDACDYAGISRETYYDRMDENKKFSDKKEKKQQEEFIRRIKSARIFPKLGCKRSLVRAGINGDWRASLEYLKRTDDEFRDKVIVEQPQQQNNNPLLERLYIIDKKTKLGNTKSSKKKN